MYIYRFLCAGMSSKLRVWRASSWKAPTIQPSIRPFGQPIPPFSQSLPLPRCMSAGSSARRLAGGGAWGEPRARRLLRRHRGGARRATAPCLARLPRAPSRGETLVFTHQSAHQSTNPPMLTFCAVTFSERDRLILPASPATARRGPTSIQLSAHTFPHTSTSRTLVFTSSRALLLRRGCGRARPPLLLPASRANLARHRE